MQTKKLERFPVVSMGGGEFWQGLRNFAVNTMLPEGVIGPEDVDFLHRAETPAQAIEIIKRESSERVRNSSDR